MDPDKPNLGVAAADREFVELTVTAIRLLRVRTRARSAALFTCTSGEPPRLVVSDGIDQGVVDDAQRLASQLPAQLHTGAAFRGQGSRDFVALPCCAGGQLRAFAYLEEPQLARTPLTQLQALADIVALSVVCAGGEGGGTGCAVHEGLGEAVEAPDVANLLFTLERNEWNVARVARVLGVTRMTIYNRMRSAGIARQRVSKSRPRGTPGRRLAALAFGGR